MKFSQATAIAVLAGAASAAKDERTFAVLRFNNLALTTARADPIVSPNQVGSHVHNVLGGSNFGLGSTGQDLLKSNCSTAMVKGDNSNYWYPLLYFRDPKTGTFESVDVFYTNVYYFFEPTNDDIKAFPVGLSMVSGNPSLRLPPSTGSITQLDPSQGPIQPVKMTCPRNNNNFDNPPSWPANSDGTTAGMRDPVNKGEGVGFPDVNCDGYASPLRMDIHFPSCYNPAAGLTNYKDNMVFPSDAGNGKSDCPKGYIHTPHIFFEVYWNTPLFVDRWDQNQGTQPFVLANGDNTGYSAHADFMAAWDEDLLQGIIDNCNTGTGGMDTCPGLTYGLNKGDCTIPSPVNEQVMGNLTSLPGDNPVTGWQFGLPSGYQNPPSGGSSSPPPSGGSSPSSAAYSPPAASSASGSSSSGSSASSSSSASASSTSASSAAASSAAASSPSSGSNYAPPSSVAGNNDNSYPTPTAQGQSAAAVSPSSKPTSAPVLGSSPSLCKGTQHTVWETVTVTVGSPVADAAVPTPAPASNSTTTAAGFKLAGCFKDSASRVLKGESLPNLGSMTNEKCVQHCQAGGYSLAATEYGTQCFCGNDLEGSSKLEDSSCNSACEGDSKSICGGGWALSVYSKDGEASMKSAKVRRALNHIHKHRGVHH